MKNEVNDWVQEGRLFVWRYAMPSRNYPGWHFTADPAGARSVRNLLDRMHGGEACYRTLCLSPVTDAILSVPGYASKTHRQFAKLRIDFRPEAQALTISPEGATLTMTVGGGRLRKLSAAFAEVEIGEGDIGISTSDAKRADPWMFWWMPDINYYEARRM